MPNDAIQIEESGLFDREWYVAEYPDVVLSGMDPLEHYLTYGAELSRNPGPLFDVNVYLDRYADVAQVGIDPLLHYIRFGRAEGRKAFPVARGPMLRAPIAKKAGRVAVVLHAHHLESISEVLDHIDTIGVCDLFVTTPHSAETGAIEEIVERHPDARIFTFPGSDCDTGPFISIWKEIEDYEICCKLRTERKATREDETRRRICFDAMLGSEGVVSDILACFDREPRLAILGPECMYKSGAMVAGIDEQRMRSLEVMMRTEPPPIDSPDWGFFAGSVFWFRPALTAALGRLRGLDFGRENCSDDRDVTDAVERLFGSRILSPDRKIGLARRNPKGGISLHVENTPATPDREPYVDTLEKYANVVADPSSVIGALDEADHEEAKLSGWLAARGDVRPRRAVLEFDGRRNFRVICDAPRADLAAEGVDGDRHAFQFVVPAEFEDGLHHDVALIDALSGERIATRKIRWTPKLPDLDKLTSHVPEVETVVVLTGDLDRDIGLLMSDLDHLGQRFDLILPASAELSVDDETCNDVFRVPTSTVVSRAVFLQLANSGFLCKYRNICWVDFGAFPTEAFGIGRDDARLVRDDVAVAATTVVRQDVATWSPDRKSFVASALERIQRSRDDFGEVDVGRGILWIAPLLLWQLRACRLDPLVLLEQTDGSATISGLLSLFARSGDMTVTSIAAARHSAQSHERLSDEIGTLKAIAFLVPESPPVPESDRGSSAIVGESTDVVRGRPLFRNHDQPKLPADLAFDDLPRSEAPAARTALARRHGLSGFCCLHRPDGDGIDRRIAEMLASPDDDMPFCVCVTNEGGSPHGDEANRSAPAASPTSNEGIDDVVGLMRDPRYIRQDGKPVLVLHRTEERPDWTGLATRWRRACRDAEIGEIHICAVRFDENPFDVSAADLGLDSFVQFPPYEPTLPDTAQSIRDLVPDFRGRILDYDAMIDGDLARFAKGTPAFVHRGVVPSWDETARRDREARIFVGATPLRFRAWLRTITRQVHDEGKDRDLVFVGAWNDWRNGATLEPDRRYGLGHLEALRSVFGEAAPVRHTPRRPEDQSMATGLNFSDMTCHIGARADDPAWPTVLLCAHLAGKKIFGGERSFIDILDGLQMLPINIVVTLPGNAPYQHRDNPSDSDISVRYVAEVRARSSAIWVFPYAWFRDRPIDEDSVLRFSEIIVRHGVDIVHTNTIMLWEPLIAARRLGRKSVIHARELIDHDESLAEFIGLPAAEIKKRVVANCDFLIANSRETANTYSHPKTFLVPNAVDTTELDLPNELGEKIRFGLVSSNIAKKGIYDLVECAKICHETVPNAEFVVIGPDNDLITSLKSAVEKGELPSNIVFAGYKKTPREAMSEIDVLMNLSHFAESFGRTIVEAMAARRPVIAYDWGALPELVRDDDNGFLVPYRDVDSLAEKVRLLCETPSEIERMGNVGRITACRKYSRLSFTKRMIDAYDTILDDQPLHDRPLPLTVVVPIYNASYDVEICLALLAENVHRLEARVFLVDDGSTDPRIGEILNLYSRDERFRVIRNIENIGYTGAINKAIRYAPGNDILLLNSDTIVTPGWIAGLRSVAYSRSGVGTVTAMSDNAGAFSFPIAGQSNPKPPHMSHNDYARHVISHTALVPPVEVPTGSGFCMYIRGALIDEIGLFDENNFKKGYGEENDFCMRALNAGWINLVSTSTFVYHRKSASFGSAREELVRQSAAVLARLHPTYESRVKEVFSAAPMSALRAAASAAVASLRGAPPP